MRIKQIILAVLLAVIIICVGLYVLLLRRAEPQSIVPAGHINFDVYPLYGKFLWGIEQPVTIEGISGYEIVSAPITNISNLSVVDLPFEKYYRDKLTALGWEEDNLLAAGGPGSSITAYKKYNSYVIISFQTSFKGGGPNEPAQCPCDVSFSIFSGTR